MDVESAVVPNEAQFPEFIHEHIDSRASCSDHFCQRFLRDFGERLLRLVFFAIAREQQQDARQSFLRGVEELIDQVLLDSDVPGQKISNESVRELVLFMKDANHLFLFNGEYSRRCDRGR